MRRGQLLSFDAMLSLVIVIFILGTVTSTSSALKEEVTNVLGWYERANIADNMLDVLSKSPGVPANWTESPATTSLVGLRDNSYPFAISSAKIEALVSSANVSGVLNSLYNMSSRKDFRLSFYLTTTNITVTGQFPEEIFLNLTSELQNIKIALSTDSAGNTAFQVECDSVLLNGEPSPTGNAIELNAGDVLEFVTVEEAQVLTEGNNRVAVISPGSYVVVRVVDARSNYQYSFDSSGGVCTLHVGGQGQVKLVIYGNSAGTLVIRHVVIPAVNLTEASLSIAVINGTLISDESIVSASMARSPWVEYLSREVVSSKLVYEKSTTIGATGPEPILIGTLTQNVPSYAYLEVQVPEDSVGNLTLVAIDGTTPKGILVQRGASGEPLNATVAWKVNGRTYAEFYVGDAGSIRIPWRVLFSEFNSETGGKPVELWVYENSFGSPVTITDLNNLGLLLKPSFRTTVIKLWVWDDS